MRCAGGHSITHIRAQLQQGGQTPGITFRLTDQLEAAAFVRELFDEPAAQLYQVPGLLEAVSIARGQESRIDRETVISQIDRVIRAVVEAAGGVTGADVVMELIRLRDQVIGRTREGVQWDEVLADARSKCSGLINEYFACGFSAPLIEALCRSERLCLMKGPGGAAGTTAGRRLCVTINAFDGVHVGHRALIVPDAATPRP